MARQQYNDGQENVFADPNTAQARAEQELYDRIIFEMLNKTENAFFGDGHKVNFASPVTVTVTAGLGFQTDATVAATEPQKRPLYRGSSPVLTLTSPDGSLDRIDIVVARHGRVNGATESRKFKNASTSVITNENLVTSSDWETTLTIVAGTPNASPVAPATPAGTIKIATLAVTAVTGLSGSGDVTDNRSIIPIGSLAGVNTLGFLRLTASASETVQSLMAEIDALLGNGKAKTNTFADSVFDPVASTVAGEDIMYNKGGVFFTRRSTPDGAAIIPLGSGGGGGGSAVWYPGETAPLEDEAFGEKIWEYARNDRGSQSLTLFVKVPQGYLAGRQIELFLGISSPSAINNMRMESVATLIRKNNDALDSTVNQRTSGNAALTNSIANQYRETALDLTSISGQINAVTVLPGDLIKVELKRDATATDTDTADIKLIPSATEVKFG